MSNIRANELQEPVDVAEYLFRRLNQLGVKSIHGVPGDFNLVALDYIPTEGLKWVGSVNELNAGMFFPAYPRHHRPLLTPVLQRTPRTVTPG